jgi:acyl-coenzyme A thioesterase PaaI-like protein
MSDDSTALRRAANAMRAAITQLVGSTAPDEALEDFTRLVSQASTALDPFPAQSTYEIAETSLAGENPMLDDSTAFFDNSPIAGRANPLAAPVTMRIEGDQVTGEVEWHRAYEGPPGCCHGGHIAAAFDEILGLAQNLAGQSGMTGTLTIRYRRPTPLNTQHRFVGRVDRVEGRKIFTTGELYDPEGNVLAEGEAIFISIQLGHLRQIAEDQRRALEGG